MRRFGRAKKSDSNSLSPEAHFKPHLGRRSAKGFNAGDAFALQEPSKTELRLLKGSLFGEGVALREAKGVEIAQPPTTFHPGAADCQAENSLLP